MALTCQDSDRVRGGEGCTLWSAGSSGRDQLMSMVNEHSCKCKEKQWAGELSKEPPHGKPGVLGCDCHPKP